MSALAALGLFAALPVGFASELSPIGLGLVVAFLILSLGVHEAAHAWVALKRGDPTARDLGRITLNPIPHIDPVMTILIPLFLGLGSGGEYIFGGAKPVPVNAAKLKNPLGDMVLVALAGPFSNVLLAVLFGALYKLALVHGFYSGAAESIYERQFQLLPLVLEYSMSMNLLLAVFNLIPVPPLDGSRVMTWLLPANLREGYTRFGMLGMFLVVGLSFYPPFSRTLLRAVHGMSDLIISWVPA
ncbi:MAG: site-2 protease family protein [Planctomycetes bacterium]|nr:site-2 protease family protein [Planctomycetota bacterium]